MGGGAPKPAVGSTGDPGLDRVNWAGPGMGGNFMFGNATGQAGGMNTPNQFGPWSSPPPAQQQTQRNPQLQAIQGDYQKYREGLAAGTDQDAINAMQRQRDLTSGMAKEAGDAGMMRDRKSVV